MLAHLLSLAADGPLRLVVEDEHWIAPSTRELIERLAGRVGDRAILIAIATRGLRPLSRRLPKGL